MRARCSRRRPPHCVQANGACRVNGINGSQRSGACQQVECAPFFYYKTRFFWYSGQRACASLLLAQGMQRACTHTENCTPHRRTCVRFLFSEEGSLRRSIVNLPAYRLSRSRIPLTPTCERLGMCRSNATKGIEHTDVSYKRPEGPPKPPLLQGQRWLVSSRAVGAF